MLDWLRELTERRDLLYMLTWREITIRYKQSVMGILWAVLMPLLIVLAGVLVRGAFAVVAGRPLALSEVVIVSVKAVPWAFVVASIRFATNSLISNANLVTKIYMPREIVPMAAVASQLVDFLVAAGVLVLLLALARVGVSIHLLWVPALLAILVALTLALGIFLSAASLFFRDVKYLVEVVLTFAIFFAPVFYDTASFPQWRTALLLNPVAPILEGLVAAIVGHTSPDLPWVLYSGATAAAGLAASLTLFKWMEPYFAESI
jgi:ABC-type polysaccharide/polyol phosphate export permease